MKSVERKLQLFNHKAVQAKSGTSITGYPPEQDMVFTGEKRCPEADLHGTITVQFQMVRPENSVPGIRDLSIPGVMVSRGPGTG
jgi:hypothetical protein